MDDYFELGRGAKLIPRQYWHQYVLGLDLTNDEKPFVITEVGKTAITFNQGISIEELLSGTWDYIITNSNCTDLIQELKSEGNLISRLPNSFISKVKKQIEKSKELNGNWISTEEIEALDYNSNFSNWIDAYATSGYFHFGLDLHSNKEKNCHLQIPVMYASGDKGSYSIYNGKFQMTYNQILIWQNGTFPAMIKYSIQGHVLSLELFGKKIDFIRE